MDQHYPFTVLPLPYAYDALAPALSEEALRFHHDAHYAAYVKNLNETLCRYPAYHNWTLSDLISHCQQLPTGIRRKIAQNVGGVHNHALHFASLTPHPVSPPEDLLIRIEAAFGSLSRFYDLLVRFGMEQFGSGYGFLICDSRGRLGLTRCANQMVPLTRGMTPLCAMDVWEHAYYLDYRNRREDYLRAMCEKLNWEFICHRLTR